MRNPGMQKNVQKEPGSAAATQPTNGSTLTQNGANGGSVSKVKKSMPTASTTAAVPQKKSKPQTPSQAALTPNIIESQPQIVNSVVSKMVIEKQPMTNGDQNQISPAPTPAIEGQPTLVEALPIDPDQPVQLYCICRTTDESNMIGCDKCDEWYHFACVGIDIVSCFSCH